MLSEKKRSYRKETSRNAPVCSAAIYLVSRTAIPSRPSRPSRSSPGHSKSRSTNSSTMARSLRKPLLSQSAGPRTTQVGGIQAGMPVFSVGFAGFWVEWMVGTRSSFSRWLNKWPPNGGKPRRRLATAPGSKWKFRLGLREKWTAIVWLSYPFGIPGTGGDCHETFSSGLSDLRHRPAIWLFGIRPSGDSSGTGTKFAPRERACEVHGDELTRRLTNIDRAEPGIPS